MADRHPMLPALFAALIWCAALLGSTELALGQQPPCRFEVVDVIQAPGVDLFGHGLSSNGRFICGKLGNTSTMYRYDRELDQMLLIPDDPNQPGEFYTLADVNDAGVMVGQNLQQLPGGGIVSKGIVYDSGQITYFDSQSVALGINNASVVCGSADSSTADNRAYVWTAQNGFTYFPDTASAICWVTDINELGATCGERRANTFAAAQAVKWSAAGVLTIIGQLAAGQYCQAKALNNAGQVVGSGKLADNNDRAFVWNGNPPMVQLPPLAGLTRCSASSINTDGIIGGNSWNAGSASEPKATLWYGGVAHEVLTFVDHPAIADVRSVPAILNNGDMLVGAIHADGRRVAAVLEPIYQSAADINDDCSVNVDDLLAVINAWGACRACPEDVTGDGAVSVDDLLMVINDWG